MDRLERLYEPEETFRSAFRALQAGLWTALPGVVAKFPGSAGGAMTVDVQPTIRGKYTDEKAKVSWITMPVLLNCPLLFQGGGGVTATFPIKVGDECLVVFASRCIDAWWQQGGVQNQAEVRLHSLSDGFAIVGVRSLKNSHPVDTANACLITDDGATYFKLNPTSKVIAVQASGGINLNGVTIDSSGNLATPGTLGATGNITTTGGSVNAKTSVLVNGVTVVVP